MNWKKTAAICAVIILGGVAVTTVIFMTEPKAVREGATRETAMLVNVVPAEVGTWRPSIEALGTVEAAKDIELSARVRGEILEVAPQFTPGGRIPRGGMILRLDPADYEAALRQRESELQQAKADLRVEEGRRTVALRDFELVDEELAPENRALVLREPQLSAAEARVASAEAAVRQAELDLQRTVVRAPFNALVLERDVNLGSQVAPGDVLGRLVGIEEYWVRANVPLSKLRWIEFPDAPDGEGASARVRNRAAWPEGAWRDASVSELVGALDEDTRLARVIVSVPDPLGDREITADAPVLIIGSFVEVAIEAKEIEQAVRVNRDYVRSNDTAWVMRDGVLEIRELEVPFRDARYAYVSRGLNDGDAIVTTNLSTVTEGAKLRVEEETDTGAEAQSGSGD